METEFKVMEPEMFLDANRDIGISQPGLTQGVTYVDCNGNTRYKYETLETITSSTATQLKGELDEVQTSKTESEVVKEHVSAPDEKITQSEKPADPVEKPIEKVIEKPKPKPAVKKKPVAKAPVKKTVAKK